MPFIVIDLLPAFPRGLSTKYLSVLMDLGRMAWISAHVTEYMHIVIQTARYLYDIGLTSLVEDRGNVNVNLDMKAVMCTVL